MSEQKERPVREIAGEIVASYVSNNQLAADQIPDFIRNVIAALGGEATEATSEPAAAPQEPAVSIRRSVREDAVICLECGATQKTLKRHISVAHGLSEAEYRQKWGLSKDHPIVAPSYSKERSAMARRIGLGRKRSAGG